MELPLNKIKEMKEVNYDIDSDRVLRIEDHGRWLTGYRNEIFRVVISRHNDMFLVLTIHNMKKQDQDPNNYFLTNVMFRWENINEKHPKFEQILKMYGPVILKALN